MFHTWEGRADDGRLWGRPACIQTALLYAPEAVHAASLTARDRPLAMISVQVGSKTVGWPSTPPQSNRPLLARLKRGQGIGV